jgi:hypothetical protein
VTRQETIEKLQETLTDCEHAKTFLRNAMMDEMCQMAQALNLIRSQNGMSLDEYHMIQEAIEVD